MKKFILLLFSVIIILFKIAFAQETIILQDPLQGSTVGTKVGGTFTAEGYKPGYGASHILYDFPSQVTNGYIEFQIKNFIPSNITSSDGNGDCGLFGLYDGRGIAEPIPYFEAFKCNYFRWNFHYREQRQAFKAVLTVAAPLPERIASTYAVFPYRPDGTIDRDWFSEPTGINYTFNTTSWYTVRCEWNNKTFTVSINGTPVWGPITGPYDYAPIDFKMWLGSAPGYGEKYINLLPDVIYRNFKLVSYGAVSNSAPSIISNPVTTGAVGTLYSYDVNATGNPTPTYSLITAPSGMTINSSTGLIQWTPTDTGSYNVTVAASNGVSPDASQSFTVTVHTTTNFAPTITSTPITVATVGQLYSYNVETDANPNPTYSLTTSPSGMTINSSTGVIQWTPTATGNFNVTVKAANGISPDATQSFTINVQSSSNFAPIITSTPITVGSVGQLYTYNVETDANPNPTYTLTTFPSGMTINSTTGVILWTPVSAGNYDVVVKAANGISPDATQSFTIVVQGAQSGNCPPTLISYWKLDETSGTTYADYVGTNHATTTDAPTPSSGRVNGSQLFNGTSDKMTIPYSSIYDWSANSSFTLEAWIKHLAAPYTVNEYIVGRKDNSTLLSIKMQLTPGLLWGVRSKTGNESFELNGPDLYDNTWHHVVGVKDGNLHQLRLYLDGALIGTVSASYTSGFDSPSAQFTIGWKNMVGDYSFFNGSIDEVAIYNGVLDAASILQHYNNGLQNLGYCSLEPQESAPIITSSAVIQGRVGQLYSYDVNASGYPAPVFSLTNYPSGMTIDTTSGVITWTPLATGSFDVTVKAANGIAPDATQSFTITVQEFQGGQCSPNLISYWKLDESSGSSYADYIGTNNATSSNAPTPSSGKVDGAQSFNGTSNGIVAGRIASYDFATNTSFTFEAWIWHAAGTYITEEIILERKPASGNLAINLKIGASKTLTFSARNITAETFSVSGSKVLFDGNWHHVVGVRDASSNLMRVYVDGVLENTVSATFTAGFTHSTQGISIGWRSATTEKYFKGIIDEVAIYNVALDGATILQHYNNGLINLGYCDIPSAPVITSTPSTTTELNQQYSYDVNAIGAPAPKYYLVTFPSGMTIDSISGLIHWTPTVIGEYPISIKAANGINPDATQSFTLNVISPLQAPSNLTAVLSTVDSHNVKLTWVDNSNNELGFIIERKLGDSLSSSTYEVLGGVTADINTYEDTSVADTTMYTYRVYAFDSSSVSLYSNQAQVVSAVPVELTSFSVSEVNGKPVLEWETAAEKNNYGFTIQRSDDGKGFIDIGFVNGKGTTVQKSLYSFTDNSILSGKYIYRLKQIDFDGSVNYSRSVLIDLNQIRNFSLGQNYPNPFNPSTKIRFSMPVSAKVNINIYNQLGEIVASPVDNNYDMGVYEVEVDLSNLASGVYFYRIIAGNFSDIKKMVLTK